MSASSLVPSGGPLHCTPVYFWGIAPPGSKTGLDTSIATLVLSAVVDLSIVPVVAQGAAVVVCPRHRCYRQLKPPKVAGKYSNSQRGFSSLYKKITLKEERTIEATCCVPRGCPVASKRFL